MSRPIAVALLLLLLPTMASAQTSEQDWELCPKIENEDAAIEACTRIIERKGEGRRNTGIAYSNRCGAHGRKRQEDQGLSDCNNAIRLLPDYSMAYNNRGNRWRAKSERDKALADYNKAIELDAKNAFAFNNRGLIHEDRRDYDKALVDYNKAIELDPTYFTAYLNRGDVLRAKGDYERAMADYQKAATINPRDSGAQESLGGAFAMLGQYERAIRHLTTAINIEPTLTHAPFARGAVYLYQGEFAKAAADLRRAADLNANSQAMVYRYIARARQGETATNELQTDAARIKDRKWPHAAIELFLGRQTPDAVRAAAATPSERCEAHFFVAQWHLIKGETDPGRAALRSAADTCPNTDYEKFGAREELRRLGG